MVVVVSLAFSVSASWAWTDMVHAKAVSVVAKVKVGKVKWTFMAGVDLKK
tara:strand:+ start:368 stop:517 length:150 start_codon:yes stop_codon:yes gene_type:complete